jgi:HPt (histidine-containing phosphotransfer) domain-containing protein
MKGSLATLGAEAGAQIAFQLEMMGRKHRLEGSESVCRALEDQLDRLDAELKRVAAGA